MHEIDILKTIMSVSHVLWQIYLQKDSVFHEWLYTGYWYEEFYDEEFICIESNTFEVLKKIFEDSVCQEAVFVSSNNKF